MERWLLAEILETILCYKSLSVGDVLNVALINRYSYGVVISNNKIWKKKYLQTWPQFLEVLDKHISIFNWHEEVQYIYNLKRRSRNILSLMCSRFYTRQRQCSDSDFTEWLELYQEKPQTYYYLVDDLMSIVNTHIPINSIEVVPITTPGNRTLQFHAKEALRFLRKLHLIKEWKSLPQKHQTLEKRTAFINQWFNPNVDLSWNNIAKKIDKIAEEVKEYLKIIHPNHPLFDVTQEKLKMWRNANIKGNKYGKEHCRQIVQVLQDICYRPGFSCAIKEFLEAPKDPVAENILLMIVRESVARRLGLKWQPVKLSVEYTMQLSHEHNVEDEDDTDINAQDKGLSALLTKSILKYLAICTQQPHPVTGPRKHAWIFTRRCSLYELLLHFDLYDAYTLEYMADLYINYNMNCTPLIESITQKIGEVPDPERLRCIINKLKQQQASRSCNVDLHEQVEAKVRPSNLKYAVGMVMQYRRQWLLPYTFCVICDWDPVRLAPDGQPIYSVLLTCGSYMDIPEGILAPAPHKTSAFDLLGDIGIHFSYAFKTHFVPNAEKEKQYPDDGAVRHAYHHNFIMNA